MRNFFMILLIIVAGLLISGLGLLLIGITQDSTSNDITGYNQFAESNCIQIDEIQGGMPIYECHFEEHTCYVTGVFYNAAGDISCLP